MKKRPLRIIGCGGHGRVVADIAKAAGEIVGGFIDDNVQQPADLPIEGPAREVMLRLMQSHRFAIGIGDGAMRRSFADIVWSAGGELATLVHPSAIIATDVAIGEGAVVMAGVVVNTGSRIGRIAVLNTGAIIDHDNIIEDNVQIAPGCTLAGRVTCRQDAFVGVGATVLPCINIGEGAFVAAGATVVRNVSARTLVAGCPATEKKRL